MSDNDGGELPIAIAAMCISIVALFAAVLQVTQQYYASAAGYSNCNHKVIGKWSQSKKRILRAEEFRFEVRFETPVIFLCPPTNRNGPVRGQTIYFLNGSPDSLRESWTDLQGEKKADPKPEKAVITADNEQASWILLLSALQRMEHDSREWQAQKHGQPPLLPAPPPKKQGTLSLLHLHDQNNGANLLKPKSGTNDMLPTSDYEKINAKLNGIESLYTLTAAIQRKRRSWDTMPTGVKRPYATTTMCHLVEMLAILGIYWIEFDRRHDRYRAEGNGYMVMGEKVSDLGIMFTFQVCGQNRFLENRVIPVDEVKELCFGFVPTVYRATSDNRRLAFPNDEPRDLSALQLSSRAEIAETLVLIGCNTNTVNFFLQENRKDSHLFPIAFEILGMIGRNLHIKDSCFRQLPNPTLYRWDRKNFSLRKMLESYRGLIDEKDVLMHPNSVVLLCIKRHIEKLQSELQNLPPKKDRNGWLSLPLLNVLHEALDDMDEVLTAKEKTPKVPQPDPTRPPLSVLGESRSPTNRSNHERHGSQNKLSDAYVANPEKKAKLPTENDDEKRRRQMVQDVLRSHLQEVLHMINEKPEAGKANEASDGKEALSAPVWSYDTTKIGTPRFEDIDEAAPEDKQRKFMEVYFKVVLKKVVPQSSNSTKRRLSAAHISPVKRTDTMKTAKESLVEHEDEDGAEGDESNDSAIQEEDEDDENVDPKAPVKSSVFAKTATPSSTASAIPLWELSVSHEDIWCTLVFRMMCWLMLHDFHKKDVQMSKSELLGSRLPVYIA